MEKNEQNCRRTDFGDMIEYIPEEKHDKHSQTGS